MAVRIWECEGCGHQEYDEKSSKTNGFGDIETIIICKECLKEDKVILVKHNKPNTGKRLWRI